MFRLEYMTPDGKWHSYINMPGTEQGAMACAMARAKAEKRPIRVKDSKGAVVGFF